MTATASEDVVDKIRRGLDLAEMHLLNAKARNNETLTLYRNSQITHVKAGDLLREREHSPQYSTPSESSAPNN